MAGAKRVALLIGTQPGYGRRILRGVASYVPESGPWRFHIDATGCERLRALQEEGIDGVIARAVTQEADRSLAATGLPAVNVSARLETSGLPRVTSDSAEAARLAACHLLDRGYRSFGFFGDAGRRGTCVRRQAFREAVHADFDHTHYDEHIVHPDGESPSSCGEQQRRLAAWVRSLKKPAAVLGVSDVRAWRLSEVCRTVGVRIPDEVAIVGIGNDDVMCDLARPRLTSVDLGQERVGYEAARALDRMFTGQDVPREAILVPPKGVVCRQSSDWFAVEDPELVAALRFIRDNAGVAIGVEDVLGQVNLSRRTLERRFRRVVGRTIAGEIRRAHTRLARRLLVETDLPMPEVARRAGFDYPQRLSTVFRAEMGTTPTAYRERYRWR